MIGRIAPIVIVAVAATVACASAPSTEKPLDMTYSRETIAPGAPVRNEAIAELVLKNPDFKGARLVENGDFGNEYDREWMKKMGYSATVSDDFENDGNKETAGVLVQGNAVKLVIMRRELEGWKKIHGEDMPGPVMIRSQSMGGTGGTKCILIASGQRGNRFSICWDGYKYTRVTL